MLKLELGTLVEYQGEEYFIHQILDLSHLSLIHTKTQKLETVLISQVTGVDDNANLIPDLHAIPELKWQLALKRFEIIKPLLVKGRTRQIVSNRAQEFNLSTNTLYGWISRYEKFKKVTDLLRETRSDKGEKKTDQNLEKLINDVIRTEYLSKQKKSKAKVCREIARQCSEAGIKAPHSSTVIRRINNISKAKAMAARESAKEADNLYSAIEGEFPNADWPLAFVQVDHTELDIQLCDDYWRKPVGRPWVTIVFDVFSRMVLGFRVGFDAPSALVTGLAISHAVLPKEEWLAKYEINGEWPCWGLPDTLHMDNGKDFRGEMIQRACDQYKININWRPVARPQFGAHIERYLGTLNEELKGVQGATFSNIFQKRKYNSEERAVLTLSELEEWLTLCIVGKYHNEEHSALGMSPLQKYRQGLLGNDKTPGKGLPARITDEQRFRLDFTPFIERTVQRKGVVIDEVFYFADVLRKWVNAADLENPKVKRKFIFRRDPRDISHLWFYDPDTSQYYPIPYRNLSYPAVSLWELKAAQARNKEERNSLKDEATIFRTISRMREIEESAARNKKQARRNLQRKAVSSMPPIQPKIVLSGLATETADNNDDAFVEKKVVKPFDDLDEML